MLKQAHSGHPLPGCTCYSRLIVDIPVLSVWQTWDTSSSHTASAAASSQTTSMAAAQSNRKAALQVGTASASSCVDNVVCLLVGCLTSQQHAGVSQGWICSDNCRCCHTEIEVAGQTFYLTQSQYTDTGTTSPSPDPITPGAWQSSHWSANF